MTKKLYLYEKSVRVSYPRSRDRNLCDCLTLGIVVIWEAQRIYYQPRNV